MSEAYATGGLHFEMVERFSTLKRVGMSEAHYSQPITNCITRVSVPSSGSV